jgi:DNA repair protein RecN (Recombination protein N)
MLKRLRIQDFILIEHLELHFKRGLTVITGETGAGKSILIDALELLLGQRADSGVVRQEAEQAELNGWFGEHHLQRIISKTGRSRATIDGKSVTIQELASFGETLVHIHGQHAQQDLVRPDYQRQVVDERLDPNLALASVQAAWETWKTLYDELQRLGGQGAERSAQIEWLRYQVAELQEIGVEDLNLPAIEAEHRRLAHAEQLQHNIQQALMYLDQDDAAVMNLHRALREVQAVQTHDKRLQSSVELLDSALIQAREVADELRHYLEHLDHDPERLLTLDEQFTVLQRLARKHQVSLTELPDYFRQLQTRLQVLEKDDKRATEIQPELQLALEHYREVSTKLSQQRQQLAEKLSDAVTAHAQQLGMPHLRFIIDVVPQFTAPPSALGFDNITFLISTNIGQPPKPLQKVASGGELSRLSLALQVVISHTNQIDTLIFDEADVGVGGGIAEVIGRLFATLGLQRQVLCITHLPQIAAFGKQHFHVSKQAHSSHTRVQVKNLQKQERILELARLLGGISLTEQTVAHAREMLEEALNKVS